jgi:hypothetical protein
MISKEGIRGVSKIKVLILMLLIKISPEDPGPKPEIKNLNPY